MIFHKGRHNISKIVCLALGLAISLVIIAEIYYEQTYETYFKGSDRTYCILENYKMGDMKDAKSNNNTPGGWAQGLKRYAPMIEAATRSTNLFGETQLHLDDGRTLSAQRFNLADSCFFDVFPQRILVGKPREVLSRPGMVMINSDIARKIGGNVVGRHFTIDQAEGATFTIGGVFETFPCNSGWHDTEIFLSLNSFREWGFDGMDRWVGNDRYSSFIRIAKGHKPEELQPYAKKALEENADTHELGVAGIEIKMEFITPNALYNSDPYIKQMKWILSIVAFVLLFSSVMNYLLIVVGNMVGRSREMAVRKCYGAERHNIYALGFRETAIDVALALALAALLIFLCKGTIENFLSAPVQTLIFNRGSWLLVVVILLILFVCGIVPGWLYNRTPVTVAFRGWSENRHRWKLGLLAAELAVVGMMLSLLFVVSRQYHRMTHIDPGYDYNNVAVFYVQGINNDQKERCLTELSKLPFVKMTSSADRLPIDGWFGAGNNVMLPGGDRELFNAEDLYGVSDRFFDLMGIKIKEGTFFTDRSDTCRQIMVDENFAQKLKTTAHLKGSVVGQRISVSEHCSPQYPTVQIVGVFSKLYLGSVTNSAETTNRPLMIFYTPKPAGDLLLKLTDLTPERMTQLNETIQRLYPGKVVRLYSYASQLSDQYASQRHFRNGILAGGIVVLIIALFGLVGYTSDEVNRRSKEIAIRKVNGAQPADILQLLTGGILKIALPSIIVGCIGAWLIAAQWLQNFSVRIALTPWPFIIVTIVILLIIGVSVVANSYRIARSNPVKYLKNE